SLRSFDHQTIVPAPNRPPAYAAPMHQGPAPRGPAAEPRRAIWLGTCGGAWEGRVQGSERNVGHWTSDLGLGYESPTIPTISTFVSRVISLLLITISRGRLAEVICLRPARTCGLTRTMGRLPVRVSLGNSAPIRSQIFSIICGEVRTNRPRSVCSMP